MGHPIGHPIGHPVGHTVGHHQGWPPSPWTLDLSIIGSNPMCDTLLRTCFVPLGIYNVSSC